MKRSKRIPVKKLKKGDRFNFIPAAWHGPSIVMKVDSPVGEVLKITFNNDKVINWPGIRYVHKDELVTLLKKR